MKPADLEGLIPAEVGETLAGYASKATGPIVEVGSYKGKSTAYLASRTAQTVYAVDPWDLPGNPGGRFGFDRSETYRAFCDQTKPWPNIVPVQGFSIDVAQHWGHGPISLLYVDGDHSELAVLEDCRAWYPHLDQSAVLILDDWGTPKNPGVRRAADRLASVYGRYRIEAGRLAVWTL
jgi:hypothetical protein